MDKFSCRRGQLCACSAREERYGHASDNMKLTVTTTRRKSFCGTPLKRLLLLFLLLLSSAVVTFLPLLHNTQLSLRRHLDPAHTAVPCNRSLTFARVPLPVTALASVQGSGNTWLRHLLQQLTGIYTGSVYSRRGDPELWQRGYYGEGIRNGSVIAVKTHGAVGRSTRFQRAIVVIRNPYDAMFADFNRRASGSHTGVAPARSFVQYWNDFSRLYVDRWKLFHTLWVNFTGPLLILNFDDLVHSLEPQVQSMASFLSHPSLKMDIRCALADSRGSSKRSETSFDKHEVFSKEQIQHINRNIDSVRLALKARFPNVSQAISSWKRSDKGVKIRWKPLPPSLQ